MVLMELSYEWQKIHFIRLCVRRCTHSDSVHYAFFSAVLSTLHKFIVSVRVCVTMDAKLLLLLLLLL